MKTILLLLFTVVTGAAMAQDTTVVQLEYFFDADNGVGKNTLVNVTPATDGTFPFTANIAKLSVGYHRLYIRTKDSNGKWSFTSRRNVEVFSSYSKTTFSSGEYFIDSDPGYGNAFPVTIGTNDSVILQNFTAATAGLAAGYHKLYGRLQDDLGRWSHTFRRNIELFENDTNYVYKAEYFFKTDNGYGNATTVTLSNPSTDGTFSVNIPVSLVPKDADTLFIRVQDSTEMKWSLTVARNISVALPLTLLNFNVIKQNNTADLEWQTANELNTSCFNVQRSTDGKNFLAIGRVAAKGNSNMTQNYTYSDDISNAQGAIYYRLQMMDKDGAFTYSDVRLIDISHQFAVAVAPNPVSDNNLRLTIYSPAQGKIQLAVYSQSGQLIYGDQFRMPGESIHKTVPLPALASGQYLVKISDGKKTITVQFIKN